MMRDPVHPVFHKTQFCRFFKLGKCTRAGACKFAHTQDELLPVPDFKLTKMCPAMCRTGFCEKGDACTFAHSASELRTRTRTPACPSLPVGGAPLSPKQSPALPPARPVFAEAAPAPPPAPPPQPVEAKAVLMIAQAMPVQMQAVQVVPVVSMQCIPAPVPMLCSSVDRSAVNRTEVFSGATPSSRRATVISDLLSLADPFDVACCRLAEEGEDDDLDLELPMWSRQSTDVGLAEPTVEFECQSSGDEDSEYIQDSDDGDEVRAEPFATLEKVDRALQPDIAAALGHRYVVKNTFIEFEEEDEEGVPGFGIRRVNSARGDFSLLV